METKILQRLKDIESKYDVKVLLAVESGSRAFAEWLNSPVIYYKDEIADLVRLKQESREHNTMIVSDSLVAFAVGVAAELETMFGRFPDENLPSLKKLDEFFLKIINTFDI